METHTSSSFLSIDDDTIVDLDAIIDYMEATNEDSWCTNFYSQNDNSQKCFLFHLYDGFGGRVYNKFESTIATEYMIFPVNDGYSEDYPQPTPRQRCIQYIKDLRDGIAPMLPEVIARSEAYLDSISEENEPPIDFEALDLERMDFEKHLITCPNESFCSDV